jgi:hypothetical protein
MARVMGFGRRFISDEMPTADLAIVGHAFPYEIKGLGSSRSFLVQH